jgi:hypothetical protein
MTSAERRKRPCFGAVSAVVIASTVAVITSVFFENQARGRTSGTNGILPDRLGIPLAPGWLLTRGTFEKAGNLSSLNQIVEPAFLVPIISGVIDTGVIFGAWEFIHGKIARASDSGNTSHT